MVIVGSWEEEVVKNEMMRTGEEHGRDGSSCDEN